MTYLKQIIGEMRQQPLIGTVTLAGTALAIFLIMIVVMTQELNVTPIAPESNRGRFLHARFFHSERLSGNEFCSSSTMSYAIGKRLYNNLEHTDTTTFFSPSVDAAPVSVHGKTPCKANTRYVDGAYWKVFDFTFLNGSAFTGEDVAAGMKKAVISQSVARELFGTTDATGREFQLNHYTTYTVAGVVKDVPTVTSLAYAQVWIPLSQFHIEGWSRFGGNIHATILAKDKDYFPAIKAEINRRVEALNSELKSEGIKMADHDAPYPQEVLPLMRYSNITPDYETARKQRWGIYAILLLIPAINLSSITHSRLRRRMSEIGIRRAFGCTRLRLISNLLTENMIMTLAGGIIGFMLSVAFSWLAADMLFANHDLANTSTGITPMMMLHLDVFLSALLFCFLLNILSGIIPAWRASRLNPVEAIGGMQK